MDWEKVKENLEKKLDPAHIKPPPQGKYGEYLEGWHVIAEANRIFGFGGWSDRFECHLVATEKNAKDNHVVTYTAKAIVTVGDVVREGYGSGEGIAKTLGAAHESAIKEAETDALKRALRKFGNVFGLALYDKKRANVGEDATPGEAVDAIGVISNMESLTAYWSHLNKINKRTAADASVITAKNEKKAKLTQNKKDAA